MKQNFYTLLLLSLLCACQPASNSVDSVEYLGNSDIAYNDGQRTGGISAKEHLQAPTKFVEGSKDIPLALGLEKISDDGLDFDSVSGSIIAATYKSSQDLDQIKDFYSKTLPEMGWKKFKSKKDKIGMIKFKRDNEKLEIEFINYNGDDLVKFFIETTSR